MIKYWRFIAILGGIVVLPAFGEPYVKAAAGVGRMHVGDLAFVNPVGAGFTANPVDGDRILLSNVANSASTNVWGLALGYRFERLPVRAELRYDARDPLHVQGDANFFGGDYTQRLRVKSSAWMGYLFYDVPLSGPHAIYVGAGVGQARNQASGTQGANLGLPNVFPSHTRTEWATGLALGYAFQVAPATVMEFEYDYTRLGKVSTGATGDPPPDGMNVGEQLKGKLSAQEFRLGLRRSF